MFPDHLYACSRQEELWRIRGSRKELHETRSEEGHCLTVSGNGLVSIRASDDFARTFSGSFTTPRRIAEELRAQRPSHQSFLHRLLQVKVSDAWLRVITSVRAVESDRQHDVSASVAATIRAHREGSTPLSITTDPKRAVEHLALLEEYAEGDVIPGTDYRPYAMVWTNGSGAVLVHEAIGHPAEQGNFVDWPDWLEVDDQPSADSLGHITLDDTAQPVSARILSSGEMPAAFRRESFRDVPLRRMTSLVVSSSNSRELPPHRIEVLLLGGGSYDAITDLVRLKVAASRLVSASSSVFLAPFTFVETRQNIRRALVGSHGRAASYPGVICNDEGQRLPVGAIAPNLVTEPFGGYW